MPELAQMTGRARNYQIMWLSLNGMGSRIFSRLKKWAQEHQVTLEELWRTSGNGVDAQILSDRLKNELNNLKKMYTPTSFVEKICQGGVQIVLKSDENYPKSFSGLSDMPEILFCLGNLALLEQKRSLAVVGSRKLTSYGRLVTEKLVSELVRANFLIVSGFMYGVDSLAHQTAIQNRGSTIGVLGFGFNKLFPRSNQKLFEQMLVQGNLFLTEYLPDVEARPEHFPRRNRLVAALSLGVLVTEAALKSGSHITANFALEYGRFVGAVPGPIDHPFAEGTKYLINQGAKLVTTVTDILEELNLPLEVTLANPQVAQALSLVEAKILQLLKERGGLNTDQLVNLTGLSITATTTTLTLMEMNGLIKSYGSIWQAKKLV